MAKRGTLVKIDEAELAKLAPLQYTDEEIAGAREQLKGRNEMEALIAYLQVLGTALKGVR